MPLLFGFFNSPYDWLVIALLAFLFFGNRLPTVMRSLGEGVTEFKKGMEGSRVATISQTGNSWSRWRRFLYRVTFSEPCNACRFYLVSSTARTIGW